MSIPDFLSSSYKQYKEDTNCVTTWLHQTAKACGYNSKAAPITGIPSGPKHNDSPSKRLKGKDRKTAKLMNTVPVHDSIDAVKSSYPKQVRYRSITHEIIQQAKLISESTKQAQGLPNGIKFVAQRAIAARQRFASHFAAVKGVDETSNAAHVYFNETSNAAHVHFNETLQSAFDLLTTGPPKVRGPEAEDAEEEYPLTPLDVSLATTKTKKQDAATEIYELQDEEPGLEDAFDLYCFFEDLHAIEEEIKRAWTRFASGQTPLNVVTILTQAGIEMAKKLEKETFVRLREPDRFKHEKDQYIKMAMPVLYADATRSSQDASDILSSTRSLEHLPIHDLIYLPRARTLMKFQAQVDLQRMERWPPLIPSMRTEYIGRPDLMDLPEYQKRAEEDEKLTQMLLDLFLVDETKLWGSMFGEEDVHGSMFLKDEFSKSVADLWNLGGRGLIVPAAFACQIIFDIVKVCGVETRPLYHTQLLEAGKRADERICFAKDEAGRGCTREIDWPDSDRQKMHEMWLLVFKGTHGHDLALHKRMHLKEDQEVPEEINILDRKDAYRCLVVESQKEIGVLIGEDELSLDAEHKPIAPAAEHDFLITHNALQSGTLSMKLALSQEELGLSLANQHMAVFAMAYLYNALRQQRLIDIRWPEMDQVVDMHSRTLFANVVPKSPEDMLARFRYRSGLGYGRDRAREKESWKLRPGAASASLNTLVESKDAVEQVILQLEDQIHSHTSPTTGKRVKPPASIGHRRRKLQPLQVIARLEEYLPIVLRDIELDYITLTKTCKKLLEELTTAIRGDRFMGKAVTQAVHMELVHSVLDDNMKAELLHNKKKDKSIFAGGSQIQQAAEIFKSFYSSRRVTATSSSRQHETADMNLARRVREENMGGSSTRHNHAASGEPDCELCLLDAELQAEQEQQYQQRLLAVA